MDSLVSIIMPAYNSERYISSAINSVMAQTYPNWELIIVNDGSVDGTELIMREFSEKDSRIKCFCQSNAGQGAARNLALNHARGCYIAFLDSDDLWFPNKLNEQLKIINETKVDLVFSSGFVINEQDEQIGHMNDNETNRFLSGDAAIVELINRNYVPILSVLVKKQRLIEVGGFSKERSVQNAEDYHLWFKMLAQQMTFYFSNSKLFYYRVHPNQSTKSLYKSRLKEINVFNEFYCLTGRYEPLLTRAVKDKFYKVFMSNLNKKEYEEIFCSYRFFTTDKSFDLLRISYRFLPLKLFKKYYRFMHQKVFSITLMNAIK